MKVAAIGFFASEYLIALTNELAQSADVSLFLARQNLAVRFPNEPYLESTLHSKKLLDPHIKLHLVDYPNGQYLKKVGMASTLVHDIRSIAPDVVHYQSAGDPWVPMALPWLRRYPLVATIHDARRHLGDGVSDFSLNTTNAMVTGMANQIIVHGREQADILTGITRVPPQKVNVIPMGSFDMFAGLSEQAVPQDKNVVLFFGRLRAYKGIEVLVEAASEISAQVPDVRFVIAGSGECQALQQAAAQKPELFEVHNYFIEAEKVSGLFQRAALVVQPYIDASQSGIVPLAYQHGCPVVATRVGSIPEVVEDGVTGCLVHPGDAHALALAVIKLLRDDSLREKMGRNAKDKLARDLSWGAIAKMTLDVYERARR